MKLLAQNKKAFFDYELSDRYEAGIALTGSEIKALRAGKAQITGSYVKILNGECWWLGGIIQSGTDEQRTRKLMLHKNEIATLTGKSEQKSFSLIPTKLYLRRNKAKLEFALARGRKKYDKRAALREKDMRREK